MPETVYGGKREVGRALERAREETRAYTAATRYEIGRVYHRRHAEWLGGVEAELLGFPSGAHDDMVDVVSDAAIAVALSERRDSGAAGGTSALRSAATSWDDLRYSRAPLCDRSW